MFLFYRYGDEQAFDRTIWLLIVRILLLVENNFNVCGLGPCLTSKFYIYERILSKVSLL